jgi:hypothetical protein
VWGRDWGHGGLYYGSLMGSPNPDGSEPIASTYQFRVFADREDTDEIPVTKPKTRRSGVALGAVIAVSVLALGVMALLLAL